MACGQDPLDLACGAGGFPHVAPHSSSGEKQQRVALVCLRPELGYSSPPLENFADHCTRLLGKRLIDSFSPHSVTLVRRVKVKACYKSRCINSFSGTQIRLSRLAQSWGFRCQVVDGTGSDPEWFYLQATMFIEKSHQLSLAENITPAGFSVVLHRHDDRVTQNCI